MEQHRLQELIDKCLSGRASAEEQQELDDWYAAEDSGPGLDETTKEERGKQVFNNIHHRIKRPARNKWMLAAAVLLVLAAASIYFLTKKDPVNNIVFKEVRSGKEIKNLRLPDGSTVWLNAGTLIRYDSLFNKREIWLQGEAFFDVAHKENKLFQVHTGAVTTRVLGTAFNINAYDTIRVFVKRGRVMVYQGRDSSGVLLPNQELVCNADGSFSRNENGYADNANWTSGQFVFRDIPFSEAAQRLERRFGVRITFKDPGIAQCSITASFNANTALKDILEMLALLNRSNIEARSNDTEYIISGKGNCNSGL